MLTDAVAPFIHDVDINYFFPFHAGEFKNMCHNVKEYLLKL